MDALKMAYCARNEVEVQAAGDAYACLVCLGISQGIPKGEAVRLSCAVLWGWETRRLAEAWWDRGVE